MVSQNGRVEGGGKVTADLVFDSCGVVECLGWWTVCVVEFLGWWSFWGGGILALLCCLVSLAGSPRFVSLTVLLTLVVAGRS